LQLFLIAAQIREAGRVLKRRPRRLSVSAHLRNRTQVSACAADIRKTRCHLASPGEPTRARRRARVRPNVAPESGTPRHPNLAFHPE
jgi:hypothetical protein